MTLHRLLIALLLATCGLLPVRAQTPREPAHHNTFEHWRTRVRQRIDDKRNEPYDTVRDSGYWLRALRHGKIDFADSTVGYPAFVKFCWRTYRWGDSTFNRYDPRYVEGTGKNWKLILKSNEWIDSYAGRMVGDRRARLHSRINANVGVQLAFMAVSLGYTVGVTNLVHGENTSSKLDFSFTCARFAAEAFYVENHGESVITIHPDDGDDIKYTHFKGLHRTAYGLSAYYFFNHRRYAQAAAYCYSKYQRRSAGSWLAGINIQHHDMSIAVDELPQAMQDAMPAGMAFPHFVYNDYCLLAGYGYNWVLGRQWLLNATATPYIGYRQRIETDLEDPGAAWSPNLRLRMGAVYNHRQLFVGMQASVDGHIYRSTDHHFAYALEDFNVLVGVRF